MLMLDTNVVSHALRFPHGSCAVEIARRSHDEISISVIVAGELRFGIEKNRHSRMRDPVENFLDQFTVVPLEQAVDRHYAVLRDALSRRGQIVGPNDLWIAAHAISLDAKLVTASERQFSRVPGLAVANWLRQ